MEDASVDLEDDNSNKGKRNNNELLDPIMYFFEQSIESIEHKNNKQPVNLYETMLAENTN